MKQTKKPPCTTRQCLQHLLLETVEKNPQDTRLWTAQSPCNVVRWFFIIVTLEMGMVY